MVLNYSAERPSFRGLHAMDCTFWFAAAAILTLADQLRTALTVLVAEQSPAERLRRRGRQWHSLWSR